MSLITFVQVVIVCLLGAMSPGPSMAVVVNNAIFRGRYNGILTSLGHGIGIAVYATFAVLGLGLIIKTNIFVFNGLKILSIIFLIFIGVKSILNKEKLNLDLDQISIGWRPLPKDGMPIIGWLPNQPNSYVATMHSGVSLAAIVAKVASQELLDGVSNTLLKEFRPSRFS